MKILLVAVILLSSTIGSFAQSAPAVSLGGSVGITGGQSLSGQTSIVMTDATHTLVPNEWWTGTLKVTSSVALTATRQIIAPLNAGQAYNIENSTTGGQSITIIGASGTGVTIANGSSASVFSDGTNYIQVSGSGGGSGTVTHSTGALTANRVVIGNGTGDVKVDTGASTDGAGNLIVNSVTANGSMNGGQNFTYVGTPATAPTTNQFQISPAVPITTPWSYSPAATPGNGFIKGVNTGGVVQQSFESQVNLASEVTGILPATNIPTASSSALGVVRCDGITITCPSGVLTSASGSLPAGSGVIQSSNAGGTAFSVASTKQVMNAFGRPGGHRHFGDSITWGVGTTSTGPTNPAAYNGFAYIAGRSYGGTYVNYGVSGYAAADINAIEMYSNEVPTLGGASYTVDEGTNDTNIGTPSSTNQQNLFSREYLASLAYAGTANAQKVMAQAATCSGACAADNTYGQGIGSSSTTSGTSWTFNFTAPKSNDSAYVCYVVNNTWTTSTFTLALDTVNQNDPFGGTTTWSGSPDIIPIPTGASLVATPVCARFTGLAAGAHTIKFTVTGTTGATSKVEPLYVVPAPIVSPMNPSVAAISLNLQPTANTSAPFVPILTGIIQGLVTNTAADGLNTFYVDTQNALLNSNVSISLPETLSTTTYTQPGWVSDGGVQYQMQDGTSFVPLTLVGSSPAAGQYSVSSGVYTFNTADENVPLKINSTVNCGGGSLTTMVTNCIFGDGTGFHPTDTGHAVMANMEISAARARNLITDSPNPFLSGDMPGGYNLFTSSSASDWVGPNQFNAALTGNVTGAGLARGWAWGKQGSGKIWGTTMTSNGITFIAPSGIAHTSWCQYAGAVPTLASQLDCFATATAGIFEMGLTGAGSFALGVARNSVVFGQGTATNAPVQSFSAFTWLPKLAATASVNQSSPISTMAANIWCLSCGTPGSTNSSYEWQVVPTGGENTAYRLTGISGAGAGTHTVDLTNLSEVDLPGNTTVGGKQIGGSGVASFVLGATAQVGTSPTTPFCAAGYSCNSQGGAIQFTTGTGTLTAGSILTITTGITRTIFPSCPVNISSSVYLGEMMTTNTTTLTLNIANALAPSTTYIAIWNCQN